MGTHIKQNVDEGKNEVVTYLPSRRRIGLVRN